MRLAATLFLFASSFVSVCFADDNNSIALQYCDWIESTVSLANNTIKQSESLGKDWQGGSPALKQVKSYKNAIAATSWSSLNGSHSVTAKYIALSPENLQLELDSGKTVHPPIDQLDRASMLKVYSIAEKQRSLVLLAYSIYIYMIGAESPEDPRWKLLDPLPKMPPDPSLSLPDIEPIFKKDWKLSDGTSFVGILKGKADNANGDKEQLVFDVDGAPRRILTSLLTDGSMSDAEHLLRIKTLFNPLRKKHAEWLVDFAKKKAELATTIKEAAWKLSPEFEESRTATAETKRWISSQPLKQQTPYLLAFNKMRMLAALYRQGDRDKVRAFLNDKQEEIASVLIKERIPTSLRTTWKGDVEDLLRFSSAGKVIIPNADGDGKHLTLSEVWQKCNEVAVSK